MVRSKWSWNGLLLKGKKPLSTEVKIKGEGMAKIIEKLELIIK